MLKSTQIVMVGGSWFVILSLLYLLALIIGLPVWVFVPLLVTASFFWIKYLVGKLPAPFVSKSVDRRFQWIPPVLLILALSFIIYNTTNLHEKYGAWDAWWFWNVRANFLTRPDHWFQAFSGEQYGTTFTVPVAHADYPPFLPLIVACIWRVIGCQPNEVPYLLTIVPALSIPAIIFWELYERRKLLAIAAMLFFIFNQHIMQLNSNQIGDVWIGFFLLLSIINLNYFTETNDQKGLMWAGFFVGACCWVKNEGIVIGFVLMIAYLDLILRNGRWKSLVAGAAIPLIAFVLFKIMLAPTNDMIADHDGHIWAKIADKERYVIIWSVLKSQTIDFYPELPYLLGAYLLVCIFLKTFPNRLFLAIIFIFISYLFIYLLSPHNLGWHVSTSLDRLVFQLLPAFIWIFAVKLSSIRFRREIR